MTARRRYRLISADSHVNEPPDLWTTRVSERWRERAPRMERLEQGDGWILDGVSEPISFGMNAVAGKAPGEMQRWVRFEDIARGGWDPKARLEELDADGVDAEVLYPTPRLSQSMFANRDPELHLELIRAYNDWLSEYCAHEPARLIGLALVPNRGVSEAAAELERAIGLPGLRGAIIGCYPNGSLEPTAADDAVWGRLADAGWPLHIHVSLSDTFPSEHRSPLPGYGRFFDAPNRIVQLIFEGVFDRFPTLDLVCAEVDCGWVPYFKEQIDNNYRRLAPLSDFTITAPPSEYVERHVHFAYITDSVGVARRDEIGVERILWSSDYPHISTDWPQSWKTIQASMATVPAAERELMLAGNAIRLYQLAP
jgi:predicted TIM-barrel fold metal-dependent hydrolase